MAYIDFSVGNAAFIMTGSLALGADSKKILLSKKQFNIDKGNQSGESIPYLEIKDYRLYQTNDISTELKELFVASTSDTYKINNNFTNNTQLVWGIPANIKPLMFIVGSQTGTGEFNINYTFDVDLQALAEEDVYWLEELNITISGR